MNQSLSLILKSCIDINELQKEFSKPFGWLRIFSKIKLNKIKKEIEYQIRLLEKDTWTIKYLYSFENTIFAYYDYLYLYMNNFYINKERETSLFSSMYFVDGYKTIILDIISDNIKFTIFDTITGNSFSASSSYEVQDSQKKIERICKQKIIETLINFLNGIEGRNENAKKSSSPVVSIDYINR